MQQLPWVLTKAGCLESRLVTTDRPPVSNQQEPLALRVNILEEWSLNLERQKIRFVGLPSCQTGLHQEDKLMYELGAQWRNISQTPLNIRYIQCV